MDAMEVDPDVPAESISSWFDYLTLESFLGSGSFGYVFKAISGQVYLSAVKVIFIDVVVDNPDDEAEKLRLSREYKLMRGKKHKNLVEILKSTDTPFTEEDVNVLLNLPCLQDNETALANLQKFTFLAKRRKKIETLCIQMELCGNTLRQWLHINNEIDDPALHPVRNQIVKDMYEGLKYLHSYNIMHRDFRPENIMFSFSLTGEEFEFPVKVGDFGLCRQIHSEQTKTKTLTPEVGNAIYRAPEANTDQYGIPADLFSFGLVSWEVLQRIKQKDTRSMFHNLVHGPRNNLVQRKKWWFRKWEHIILKLTKTRPKDRIKGHAEIMLIAPQNAAEIIIESKEQFFNLKTFLVEGDIVTINLKDSGLSDYCCSTDNVTFRGINAFSHQNLSLEIWTNSCSIMNLNLNSLNLDGCNDNVVSNVICGHLTVSGNRNCLDKIEILHSGLDTSGIEVRGDKHVLRSIKCCQDNHREIQNSEINKYTDLDLYNGRECLRLDKQSSNCTITNAILRNAHIDGTGHTLKDIKCDSFLIISGKDHSTENLDALYFTHDTNKITVD
ncbi:mitogen-activated protein kinase mpkC [Folsomia candida]|uniref:mitogen-activated protein kinase mpkC n=1 Tax=Folsomia candida TaxID=158441 RepID=UPI000B905F4B|nr:mitogen-activated protein kinase mpkC [Folsomia candida]